MRLRGCQFDSPQLHQEVLESRRDFRPRTIARHCGRLASPDSVCDDQFAVFVRFRPGSEFVIAGAIAGKPYSGLDKVWSRVRKRAGLKDVRLHDLRHTFASVGAGASLGLHVIGKLLGHSQATTTARYAHLDADPMRRAADAIGATIAAAMDRQPGNVVGES